MPIYDVSGNLKISGDRASQIAIFDATGTLVNGTARFIQFSGSAVVGVSTISTGVLVNLQGGGGGGSIPFTKGILYNYPILPKDAIVWRSDGTHTLNRVRGLISGSTGATASFQAARNGINNHLTATMHINANNTWFDGGTVQNSNYSSGDYLEVRLVGVSGTVNHAVIQFDFTS
jgi:hypothetical protein